MESVGGPIFLPFGCKPCSAHRGGVFVAAEGDVPHEQPAVAEFVVD